MLSNWWKYSSIRFYVLNTIWNYKFWLNAKKVYENIVYNKKDRFGIKESSTIRKRFKGYIYKSTLYLDNPGIPNIDKDVWQSWKSKGFIK